MTSVSINREKVLQITRDLWAKQGQLDLDQVDGTFYIYVCLQQEIAAIDKAQHDGRHSSYADSHLRRFLPNAPQGIFTYVIPIRPRLRDAVDMSSIQYGGRLNARGEPIHQETDSGTKGIVGLAWVCLGIRNREWTGRDVARSMVGHDPVGAPGTGNSILDTPRPPYPENESMAIIGATLYRHGEYGRQLFWDPTQEYPESPPEVWDEKGRLRILVDHSDPRWEVIAWPPMVVMSVAEPLPPESVIAEYYDRVVIEQRKWNEHLLGASNGQNVATAIRTWAIGLLMSTGLDFGEAIGLLYSSRRIIDSKIITQQRHGKDKKLLLKRVPEVESIL